MPTLNDILVSKDQQVVSIAPEATIVDAAVMMNRHRIGALVVSRDERVEGIVTERDVLRKVVAEQRDPAQVRVADIMTSQVVCAEAGTKVVEARSVMKNRKIRHLPVVGPDRKLVGMVSIGDLNAHQEDVQEQTIHYLAEYLYGNS